MKFDKEYLLDVIYGDNDDMVEDKNEGSSRWSEHHRLVFKNGDKYYCIPYSKGLTEYQDESPLEYEGDEIECKEVFPVEKTIVVYE